MSVELRSVLRRPLVDENPVTALALGICSALAVTSALLPAVLMAVAVIAVCGFAGASISLLRHAMPMRIRLIIQITIIASFVVVVDQVLKAYTFETSRALSVYVFLIVTNCIILGRVESFAMNHGPLASLADGIGNGLGYGLVLVVVGSIRELFGAGTLLDLGVLRTATDGGWYIANSFLLSPPSAFIIIGLLIWGIRSWRPGLKEGSDFPIIRRNLRGAV